MSEQALPTPAAASKPRADEARFDDGPSLLELLLPLAGHLRLLCGLPLLAGLLAFGATYLIAPTFTAQTTFLSPQQQPNAAASALASLGALAGAAGGAAGLRTPADQYVALMQSNTVVDRLIDRFKLMAVYGTGFKVDARRELAAAVRIGVGKKDGIVSVEVDDESPQRAAAIANGHVEELRTLLATLAITEAQQRRLFFERQMQQTRDKLTAAQSALQSSGFTQGALRAEPKAAADAYARLRAEATAAEVRLSTLRGAFADNASEVVAQQATLSALRGQLAAAEQAGQSGAGPDYVSKYREFKYQETLFDLFARQYELARVDEGREGALIQVIDTATPPERKSKPRRAYVALASAAATALLTALFLVLRGAWRARR